MEAIVDFLQSRLIDVRVDLRRGNAGMAEHFLDLAQVGSAGEQMGRETVSHRVGTDRLGGSNANGVLLDEFPNGFPPQSLAATGQQQPGRR